MAGWLLCCLETVLLSATVFCSPVGRNTESDEAQKILHMLFKELNAQDNEDIPASPTESRSVDCDFTSGTCAWTNEDSGCDELNWVISANVGIPDNFTDGDSKGDEPGTMIYMFVARNKYNQGESARLRSPVIQANQAGQCLTFSYYLLQGTLHILLIGDDGESQLLWSRSTNQGTQWVTGQVILETSGSYSLVIKGIVGIMGLQVALDELKLEQMPCSLPVAPDCGVSESEGKSQLVDPLEAFLSRLSGRIYGGHISSEGQWPWAVRLETTELVDGGFAGAVCGATLIHPQWVITAAHCVERWKKDPVTEEYTFSGNHDADNIRLMFGEWNVNENSYEEGSFKLGAGEIFMHPQREISRPEYGYDIALIKLPHAIQLSEKVNVACLQAPGTTFPVGSLCIAAGWGGIGDAENTQSPILKHLEVEVLSNTMCARMFGADEIKDDQICVLSTKNQVWSPCAGDSGGPLMCERDGRYYLVGATSWGGDCVQNQEIPEVYARVSHFTSWIENTMAENGNE